MASGFELGPRRAVYVNVESELRSRETPLSDAELASFETFDLIYRSLCALLYNYVPQSGHPGGSISSGRIVAGVLFDALDYDLGDPRRADADIVSYAAGHKALGLYAMWALRDEVARLADPALLPEDERERLRLEDLLGFRRNPTHGTPLFLRFRAKALDGHPTPATPFVLLSTGASGVGAASSLGLALGARDYFGSGAPRVHVVEGEGGMTPGRVSEALAAAGTACLDNLVLHVDWNQASIDSDRVCREGSVPGDYVQWDPSELAYLHDWNVIQVADGRDLQQVIQAQRRAKEIGNGQPTAIVYRTVKGWWYGIEGRASHGAGHALCSAGFSGAMLPLLDKYGETLPSCDESGDKRCGDSDGPAIMEECFWEALQVIRRVVAREEGMVQEFGRRLSEARGRLDSLDRQARTRAPRVEVVRAAAKHVMAAEAQSPAPEPGAETTLRGELGRVLDGYNRASGGALLVAAADLLASTSIIEAGAGFPRGYYNAAHNPDSRLLSVGGICEDAISGILSGLSSYGRHIGVAASYGAFLAAMGHVASRLHAIGAQCRRAGSHQPMVLVCAHAGLQTGEDGPTHADPQPLQLLQENFPAGTVITLTPWEPQEVAPLVAAALSRRPAVIAPFVTRPPVRVPDRKSLGLAPASQATQGVYRLRAANGEAAATVVLQGSGVTFEFVKGALPRLEEEGIDLDVYYVASAELFDALPIEERERIFPEVAARRAIGITDFTLPTLYRWVTSMRGRASALHPFRGGRYPGSGDPSRVLHEAGLDADEQFRAITEFLLERESR